MVRLSQKGDMPMTEKDRDQYIEVLLALAGCYEKKEEKKIRDFTPCQCFCQSKTEMPENTEV